ncbi:MAG: FtsX-like permease family protein, partial [Gemmatimonadales bacterium]|nr:FtsX-like permease family protein [Gemmatimonadales bacterium]NIN11931.1 FtsX-like permease family protein [Gemmatimonadales bacterium]NIN50485.1 FtsX-like permease family protein [Gemmatimonadales bacterium]NIP07949.1 FtsX-like permease family protein [Gemmatimonadales bacterium]NIR01967.1 FtsX-like permease family protein [Gemmatimonadales bacterium]
YPESNQDKALLLTDLREALVEDYRTSLFLLMATVGLVLLIACGNVAGLLLARGSTRRTELSVRAALGASRARLVRQLLTESVVTAVAAGILGTVLAIWFQRLILRLLPMDIPGIADTGISIPMLSFAVVLSLGTGLVFGVFPAFRGAHMNIVEDLKAGARTTDTGGARFRSGLVIAQVALSLVLLIGSGLLIRSFARLRSVDPGFNTANLLTAEIRLPGTDYDEAPRRIQFYSSLLENIRAIPGVVSVAAINQLPIRDPGNNIYVYAADNPPTDRRGLNVAFQRTVFPGYFESMGIPLLAGRGIEHSDGPDAARVLVINETMADTLFPGQNPIGRQVVVDYGEEVTLDVVGVVGDVRMSGLAWRPRLAMYGSYMQRPYYTMRLAIRTAGEPTSVARALRFAVRELDRNIPLAELATMDQLLARSTARRRVIAISLTLFASAALLLATIGLYGVLAYYVSQRTHEIGIRVALGARAAQVVQLVLTRGVGLVTVGIVLGVAAAFGVTRFIQRMLFGVEPTDPTTFAAVSLLLALIALIACLIPAWRALRVDPLTALQAE